VTVKPVDLKPGLGIDRTQSGGEGTVIEVSQDTKGDVYTVRLDRRGRERKVITRVTRRENLIVHREKRK
jgi:hypothetical protein